jgi:hypothetical protein
VIPSNSVLNRVVAITISGVLFEQATTNYRLVLDFTNVQSERQIELEGPLDGVFTLCKRTFEASDILSYTFANRILSIDIDVKRRLQKQKNFFVNIQIKDNSVCSDIIIGDFADINLVNVETFSSLNFKKNDDDKVNKYTNDSKPCNLIEIGPYLELSPGFGYSSNTLYVRIVGPKSRLYSFDIDDLGTYTQCIVDVEDNPLPSPPCVEDCELSFTYPNGQKTVPKKSKTFCFVF